MDLAADAQVYASDGIGSKVSVAETVQMQGFPAGGNLTDVSYKREVESSRSEALVLGDVKQTVAIAEKSELDLKVFPLDRIALKERGNIEDVGLKRKTGKHGFMTTATVLVKGNGIYINHICSLSACLFLSMHMRFTIEPSVYFCSLSTALFSLGLSHWKRFRLACYINV